MVSSLLHNVKPEIPMKKLQAKSLIALVFTCVALAGCTDSSITEVKKSSMRQSDFTYGEVLDDAKGCKSTEWNHHDDENGRAVVEYTCTAQIASKLIENAETDNIARVKDLTKAYDISWKQTFESLERRKNDIAEAVVQARANNAAKLKEVNDELQEAQEKLNLTLASSPETYASRGFSGYTPQLLEIGKRDRESAIWQAKLRVEAAQKRIETTKQAQSNPEAEHQFAPGQYRSASDYQSMLDGMLSWKERYYTAAKELETRELKKAEEFLPAAKDRKLQMKITFLVNKKFPVAVQSGKWIYDGKDDGTVDVVYLAAILLDPKRMQEVLEMALKSRLKFEVDSNKLFAAFPIECSEQIPTGCELRKPAL